MSRRNVKSRPSKLSPQRLKQRTEAQETEADVQETVAVFSCARETAEDCATECERRLIDVDIDLKYRVVAHEIWNGRGGRVQPLIDAMTDLIAENQRHRKAILEIFRRLEALAAQEDFHEHIKLPEQYVPIIRALFNPPSIK